MWRRWRHAQTAELRHVEEMAAAVPKGISIQRDGRKAYRGASARLRAQDLSGGEAPAEVTDVVLSADPGTR